MPSLLTKRALLSLIDLSRALTLAQVIRGVAVVRNLSHNLIINSLQAIKQGNINWVKNQLGHHTNRFLNLLNSLGLWDPMIGLSALAQRILNASSSMQYVYMRKVLSRWEPMKVFREYLSIVESAEPDDIINDLGWAMIIRTKELIRLGLITWTQKPFAKPFNKHIVTAILLRLGSEYGLVQPSGGRVYLAKI